MKKLKISVLIPAKNEPFIKKLVRDIHEELKEWDHELIIIDKSDIRPNVPEARVIVQESDGLGNAILEGLKYSSGDIIITMDGDGSHRPRDIERLLNMIDTFDIVIGSRFVKGGKTKDTTHRRIVSFVFRKLTSKVLDLDVEDSMSGFSVVKRYIYRDLTLRPIGFKINMEIMFKAKKKGYKICEVPIVFNKRISGKSKGGVKEAFRLLRYILELKLGLR